MCPRGVSGRFNGLKKRSHGVQGVLEAFQDVREVLQGFPGVMQRDSGFQADKVLSRGD